MWIPILCAEVDFRFFSIFVVCPCVWMCVFLCACVAAGGSSKQWLIGKLEITELSSYQGLSAVLDLSLLVCCFQAENVCFLLFKRLPLYWTRQYDLIITGEKSNWYLFLCVYCSNIAWLSNAGMSILDMQSGVIASLLFSNHSIVKSGQGFAQIWRFLW